MLRRSWDEAIAKVHREGKCRVCGSGEQLQCAHTIGRAKQDVKDGTKVIVKGDAIVPLCLPCHQLYDARGLDLLPYLGLFEQMCAVEGAGGIERARNRLRGRGI